MPTALDRFKPGTVWNFYSMDYSRMVMDKPIELQVRITEEVLVDQGHRQLKADVIQVCDAWATLVHDPPRPDVNDAGVVYISATHGTAGLDWFVGHPLTSPSTYYGTWIQERVPLAWVDVVFDSV